MMPARFWTTLTTILTVGVLAFWPSGNHAAANQDHGAWQQTGLKGYTLRLFTPQSGALFATQTNGVVRSDDGGDSWTRVNLPSAAPANYGRVFVPDPTNHTTMYASGAGGLYKTTNDAASWSVSLPTDEAMLGLVISSADPSVLYLSVADKPVRDAKQYRLLRTRDGGTTWDVLEVLSSGCLNNTLNLSPHPLDAQRVYRMQSCNPGGSTNGALSESRDAGTTWTRVLDRSGYHPGRVFGGRGVMPERLYVQEWMWTTSSGLFMRSDDDGATWNETTQPWAGIALPPETEYVNIGGIDTDPALADRVYTGINVNKSNRTPGVQPFLFSRVMVSDDAGASWTDSGFGGESYISDLKLGIDGQNLYIATSTGVWRLPLAAGV